MKKSNNFSFMGLEKMASSTCVIVIFFIAFLSCPTSLFSVHTPPSLAALNQLKYWSANVQSSMPKDLLSKLSPLNMLESDYFTSLMSKKNVPLDANFCTLANLACSSEKDIIQPLDKNNYGYSLYGKLSPSLDHTDPFSFFRLSLLKQGNKVHLSNLHDLFPQRSFLPSQIASKISITKNDLQKLFPQSFVNPHTREAIETTIYFCNADLKEEIKGCAKSIEDMIEFSKTAIGNKNLVALTSRNANGSGKEVIVGNVKKFNLGKTVSCHEFFLPFVNYFCHLLSSTQVYAVDVLEPQTKTPINTVMVICHMDTSKWSPNHVALKVLKLAPGQGEACHWMSQNDLIMVAKGEN